MLSRATGREERQIICQDVMGQHGMIRFITPHILLILEYLGPGATEKEKKTKQNKTKKLMDTGDKSILEKLLWRENS